MENDGLKGKYHVDNNDIVTQDPGYQNIIGAIKTFLCQKWQKLDDKLYHLVFHFISFHFLSYFPHH